MSDWAQNHLLIPNLPGDFNHDSAVNAADYVTWRKGVGVTPTGANYNLWRTNFGHGFAFGVGHVAESLRDSDSAVSERLPYVSVPEPGSLALALLMLTMSALVRCRGSKVVRP